LSKKLIYDKDGWATAKAIIMSKALRKITGMIGKERILVCFTNQLREKLGVMFGDKYTTSGWKSFTFPCKLQNPIKRIRKVKE